MLLVNAKADTSPLHRIGLIAQEFIPTGTITWEFMPGFDIIIPEANLDRLSPVARPQLIYWSYFDLSNRTFVLSGDDDRFTNHSEDPNIIVDNSRDVEHMPMIAQRDIHVGEEITCDYRTLVVVNFPPGNNYGVKLS